VPDASTPPTPDRRTFLSRSGTALGGAWVLSALPLLQACSDAARQAEEAGDPLRYFSPEEYEAAEAATARIIPTDDTPGAREARVARFMDQAFADELLPGLDEGVKGALGMADGLARTRGATSFAGLDEVAQDQVLQEISANPDSPWDALFAATMMGMFANPEYGGTADEIGWRLMGFERAPRFDPPFGYYDRIYRENGGQL
jgi:gluconate 2-dehydrogenase gamma chain